MADRRTLFFPFQGAFEHFLISPQTNWERFFNPQFFFSYNAADVSVENYVLSRVGSYGEQLGRILEVLNVLVARLAPDQLTPQEHCVVDEFHKLFGAVKAAVAEQGRGRQDGAITRGEVERVVARLQGLKRSDPAAHAEFVELLRIGIADGGPPAKAG